MTSLNLTRLFIVVCAAAVASLHAAAPSPMSYGWKQGEVYRYDYVKTIHIVEQSGDSDPGTNDFIFEGVLILEVNGKAPNGMKAVLRFDSPKITLPDMFWFSAQGDEPAVLKEKTKTVARAMEASIKIPRWNVTLGSDGTIHIESRKPESLEDCLKDTVSGAQWKQRFKKAWTDTVEQYLGLVASGDDRDILPVLVAPPQASTGEMAKIRTYRSEASFVSTKDEKAEYRFQRLAPPAAGKPSVVPSVGPPNVTMTLKPALKNTKGTALFDTKLNILDNLSEEYAFEMDYECNVDAKKQFKLHQDVTVKYELTRRSKHKPPDEIDAR